MPRSLCLLLFSLSALALLAPAALADDELNVSSSTNGVVLNDPDRNPDNIKVELRSFGSEFRYVIHNRVFPGGFDAGTGCRPEPKESGDSATISCVRLFPKVTASLGTRSAFDEAPNRFEVPASFPDPIEYLGKSDVVDTVTFGLAGDRFEYSPSDRAAVGDTVQGGGGNDSLTVQPHVASVARGGDGNDYLAGGRSLLGEAGDDILDGHGPVGLVMMGGEGNDLLEGKAEDDQLFGNEGDDRLRGLGGDDKLVPGRGSDDVRGGAGTNTVEMVQPSPNNGADVVVSGSDRDTLDYSAVNAGNLVIAGAFSATATGSVRLAGGTVADTLVASFGVIVGGGGDDSITDNGQGTAVHRFLGGPGDDVITAGDGPDELFGGPGVDNLKGGEGDDLIDAVDGIEDKIACGPGLDFASLDLVDPEAALGFVRPLGFQIKATGPPDVCEGVERANRKEGPNVEIVTRTGRVERDGSVPVRLRCPKDAVAPCAGKLTVVLQRGGTKRPAATTYALRKGASATVRARLTAAELRRARREALVVTSVEKGKFGPKTVNRVMPPA